MAFSDIKVGMKGYGLTVFRGTAPEKFDVEVVGLLHNFRPNQDLILIRTPNERLNVTHSVAGMSGSPIYLDGKMIGAYAYGWVFGAEPIAGVTPIHNMLQDLARPVPAEFLRPLPFAPGHPAPTPARRVAAGESSAFRGELATYDVHAHGKQLADRVASWRQAPTGTALAPASTPISFGGLGDRSARFVSDLLTPLGFDTLQGGGGAGVPDPAAPTRFVDGSAIGVQMIRGDLSALSIGTVTRVEGDRLVAFGHPMMQGGVSALPTAVAKIDWFLASTQRSFKIGEAVRPLGTLVNDLPTSIVVDQTVVAPTFPMSVDIEGADSAPKKHWSVEVAHDRFLAPSLVATTMGNAVETTVSERRDTTWQATTRVTVKNYGTVELRDFGIAIGGTPGGDDFARAKAVRAIGQMLNNPWEYAQIESVEVRMKVVFVRELYSLRGAELLDDVVDAGHAARVMLHLRQFNGPELTKLVAVPIPKELAGNYVDIDFDPGWSEQPDLPAPDSLAQLLANLPRLSFAPDQVLASYRLPENGVTFRGQVADRLPPSALDTLRPLHDSFSPEAFAATARVPFGVGKFVDGHDHVRVWVREVLR